MVTTIGLWVWLVMVLGIIAGLGTLAFKRLRRTYLLKYRYFLDTEKNKITGGYYHYPIIKIILRGVVHYFLIDTGASRSYLSTKVLSSDPVVWDKVTPVGSYAMTSATKADPETCKVIREKLKVLGTEDEFTVDLMVTDSLGALFALVNKESGMELSGILGCDFFEEARWVIDMDSKVIMAKSGSKKTKN